MTDWYEFAKVAPELAAFGGQRLERRIAYLATVRNDGAPRIHPVSPFFAGEHLYISSDSQDSSSSR